VHFDDVRRRAGFYLRDIDTPGGRVTTYALYVLNLVFVGLYVASTFDETATYAGLIGAAELWLALLFSLEVAVRVDSAEDPRSELTDPYTVADLLAVLPVFLVALAPALEGITFLRSLYILRVFRFARFNFANATFLSYRLTRSRLYAVRIITSIVLIFFIAGGLIYSIEADVNPDIANFWDGFYYAIIAVTTTGFGNVVPETLAGEMVTAVGLLVAAIVIPWQVASARDPKTSAPRCPDCGLDRHDRDATYCRRCGERLEFNGDGKPQITDT
jgi:Ion channel.